MRHMGLGPWGPSSAGQMPARPPSARHTGEGRGRSPQWDPLPEALYFSSEKKKSDAPSCSWRWASPQSLAGRAWSRGDAMCQARAPVPGLCGGRRSLFQAVLGRACQGE